MSKVDKVTKIVSDYFEARNIMVGTPEIRYLTEKWASKLDSTDYLTLASIVIENPNKNALSNSEIREIRNLIFP